MYCGIPRSSGRPSPRLARRPVERFRGPPSRLVPALRSRQVGCTSGAPSCTVTDSLHVSFLLLFFHFSCCLPGERSPPPDSNGDLNQPCGFRV